MIAHLFQSKHHLQNNALTLKELFAIRLIKFLDGLHALIQHLLIEGSLLWSQHGKLILLYLVWQIADNRLVCLQSAHHHRRCNPAESIGTCHITKVLYRIGIFFLERLDGTEITLVGKIHNAPIFREAILHRRTTHGDMHIRLDGTNRLALRRIIVLDVLSLIYHYHLPFLLLQLVGIRAHQSIGSQENVVREILQISLAPMIEEHRQGRGKALKLRLPVGKKTSRCYHQGMFLIEKLFVLEFL